MGSKKCISPETFRTGDLVFGEPKEGTMSDGTSFRKIPISVERSDGSTGPLYIVSEPCFSFGIQRDSKYGGYSVPLVLMDKEGPTEKQREFVRMIKKIMSACDPKPKSCLYGKNENDPIMYVKVDYVKETKEFITKFYEREDMEDKNSTEEIKPEKYVGRKNCLAKVVMEIDNLFEAKTTTLQMRARTVVLSELKRRKPDDEDFLDEI